MKMIIEPEKAIFPSVMFHVILELNFLEEQFKRKRKILLRCP